MTDSARTSFPIRVAVANAPATVVEAYLPGNYSVVAEVNHLATSLTQIRVLGTDWRLDGLGQLWRTRPYTVIAGHDLMGWTLEDYVTPRLESGLYVIQELDPV